MQSMTLNAEEAAGAPTVELQQRDSDLSAAQAGNAAKVRLKLSRDSSIQ